MGPCWGPREVANDVVLVEPQVDPRRTGSVGGSRGVPQPVVEVVVAGDEAGGRVVRREPLDASHLSRRGCVTGALAGLGQGRHDLWIGVELIEEGLEKSAGTKVSSENRLWAACRETP